MAVNSNKAPELVNSIVCVVGAGFVGLPLANAFAKKMKVVTYDIDRVNIAKLKKNNDNPKHSFTADPKAIATADFICICVPTVINKSKEPDMSYVQSATTVIGNHLKKGAMVILESSVYPGATEELVKPIIERESGYKCGVDFKLAYSPERINPGDNEHNVDKITKIVAAADDETLELVAQLYMLIAPNIFRARNIRTAEAAKLIENIQRDVNIALVNEISIILEKMNLNTKDVIDAAATKWNFQRYYPGMVGGYCIPVVPYFFTHKLEEYGYHSRIILSGRSINDDMPKYVAEMAVKSLNKAGKVIMNSKILIMGLSYKANVIDFRESPVKALIAELKEYGIDVWGYTTETVAAKKVFDIKLINNLSCSKCFDCVIVTVAHNEFKTIKLSEIKRIMNSQPILIDLPGLFETDGVHQKGFIYKRL
jgi:UDP-N-acetyl-D-glucosamine/UDP-N-acetyl-D-galactosamine dehydrogenase